MILQLIYILIIDMIFLFVKDLQVWKICFLDFLFAPLLIIVHLYFLVEIPYHLYDLRPIFFFVVGMSILISYCFDIFVSTKLLGDISFENKSKLKKTRLFYFVSFLICLTVFKRQIDILWSNGRINFVALNSEELNSIGGIGMFYLILLGSFLIGIKGKKIYDYLLLSFVLIVLFLSFVKGTLLISVIGGVFNYYYLKGEKLNFRNLIFFGSLGIFIFVFSYGLRWFFLDVPIGEIIAKAAKKLNLYILAGVGGFNSNLSSFDLLNVNYIFAPFHNFANNTFGFGKAIKIIDIVGINYVKYGAEGVYSNVNTFLGTIFLASNMNLILYLVLVVLMTFFIRILIHISNSGVFLKSAAAIFLGGFFLGWFEYYFWHSFLYYIVIFGFILDLYFTQRIDD